MLACIIRMETGQTIIAGMGELHLEIIVDRLLREFKVEANVGKPQVAYKETVRKLADVDMKYARQSGGKGQYVMGSRMTGSAFFMASLKAMEPAILKAISEESTSW